MRSHQTNENSQHIAPSPLFNVYPTLSIKYGSPYGNRRTEEENRVVVHADRLFTTVHEN